METEEHTEDTEDFMNCVDEQPVFPRSYTENNPEEEHLLTIAQRFQKHFSLLFPDRRPLLLCPANECGIKKLVTTTLRPTRPGQADLYTWEQCAQFVSNSLTLQLLDQPTELPRTLRSPQTVLRSQRGTSLEYANLLCSLLLGLNYNAYCVSGYASQHLCELDRSQENCPLQEQPEASPALVAQDEGSKYNVRREKQLHSNFVLKEEKEQSEQQDSQPQEEPGCDSTPDPLWGLRVHFWVLVTSTAKVEEDFFIEPLTGNRYPTGHPHFLGAESLWNELNVYMNMQDCTKGCQDMLWDPEDLSHWEPLVYGTTSKKQIQAEILKRRQKIRMGIQPDADQENVPSYSFDMPLSWCSMIDITDRDMEMCWPRGFKVTHFRQALLENFSPCFCPDGLVTRLTLYTDRHKHDVQRVKEWFQNRMDFLIEKETSGGFTTEVFRSGCSGHLIFHRFNTSAPEACPVPDPTVPSVTPEREMRFWPCRADGLVRRLERGYEMIETFEKRHDFLFQRHTLFGEQPEPDPELQMNMDDWLDRRLILKVVEQFHRNPSKAAGEDIAERAYLLVERRIEVTYHQEESHIIAAKRVFEKPSESTTTMKAGDFTMDMVSTFQVEPAAQQLRLHQLDQLLLKLLKEEHKSLSLIRRSQRSVQRLVEGRAEQQKNLRLEPCPWTTYGTAHAREHRQRVMLLGEEMRWLEEQQKDLLAPVLMQLNGTTDLSPDQAQTVYESCLQDFKSRMVQQARLIQQRIDEDTRQLEQKQLVFQMEGLNTENKDDLDHQGYCAKMTRQIQVSRKRLQMHKYCAPQRYKALEQQLRADPRLGPHLNTT